MMDPKFKRKWLEALRSGKYKQRKGALRCKDGMYCCLGVLCDISGMGKWITGQCFDTYECGIDIGSVYPPYALTVKLDIQGFSGILATLNDVKGKNFSEIADYIEEKL